MDDHLCADKTPTTRKNGETGVSSYHRRCRSASERNLRSSKCGVSNFMRQDLNSPRDLKNISTFHDAPTPVHQDFVETANNTLSKHRASLENDIEQLQMHLHQERSMRMMLERAMGRASSTLSPGHRQFASQTRGLIAEIELLEEEVANREKHVLSLYRSIFEHVSEPPSVKSSALPSPARIKNGVRKHPCIISSSFCSSRKFPLRPFQVIASAKDSQKKNLMLQSTTKHASPCGDQTNIHLETHCQCPLEVCEKIPVTAKSSLTHTLKDHLNQCPSKLSEELVKSMIAIYRWLNHAASKNVGKRRSPSLSRSSSEVTVTNSTVGVDQDLSCKSMVEISHIPTDHSRVLQTSCAVSQFCVLLEQLERVNASQMETNTKMAFWINVYNCLVMHAYLEYGIPQSSLRRIALFHKAAYNIGGHTISANSIEHSILCCRMPRTGGWFENILSTAIRKKSREERQLLGSRYGLLDSQPLIFFALCSGAHSDPVLKVYTAKNVKEELEKSKKEFLQANVVVSKSMKVFLPKIVERYAKEACISSEDLLAWVSENVDKELNGSIRKCMDRKHKHNGKASQIIEWLPYNSRFRYVLSSELTEKPWWMSQRG